MVLKGRDYAIGLFNDLLFSSTIQVKEKIAIKVLEF